jgi:hypothetical protein
MENHAQFLGQPRGEPPPTVNIELHAQRNRLKRWHSHATDRCMWLTTHIRTDFDRFNRAEIRWLVTLGQMAAHDALNEPNQPPNIARGLYRTISWPSEGLVTRQDGLWLPETISEAEANPMDFAMLRHSEARKMWRWLLPW